MVLPPGLHTASFSSPGCLPLSKTSLALPSTIWAAYSCALARGRPQATPPSASASMNWYTQAGPQPETQLAASIRVSGTGSSRPAGAISLQNSASSSAVTWLEQYWIIPSPTEAGVLGMMRMTG